MAEIPGNEDKIFEYYLNLPKNVRTRAIDKMEPDDRCRLTRCSKQCKEEAMASRNYIYELKFTSYIDNRMKIKVQFGNRNNYFQPRYGYKLEFTTVRPDQKMKRYHGLGLYNPWEIRLDSSADIAKLAVEEFKCLLEIHQKTVRKIEFRDSPIGLLTNVDFEIESLDNLESLHITGQYDVRKMLAKLHQPLKDLHVDGEKNCEILASCEEIYQVQRSISAWGLKLDMQQFQRLIASDVHVNVEHLNERGVLKIIKSWQNGTIRRDVNLLCWKFEESKFDMLRLWRLLRIKDQGVEELVEIRHYEAGVKVAMLVNFGEVLCFRT